MFKVKIYQCKSAVKFPLVSWLIRLHQKTNYSHYALGFESESGSWLFIDATSKNVAIRGRKAFFEHHKIVRHFEFNINGSRADFLKWIEPFLGTKYGVFQIVFMLFKPVLDLFKLKTPKNGVKKIVCNEIVNRFCMRFFNSIIKNVDELDLNDTEQIIEGILR